MEMIFHREAEVGADPATVFHLRGRPNKERGDLDDVGHAACHHLANLRELRPTTA
jgi:hypothetical protein